MTVTVHFDIDLRPPFAADHLLGFLASRAIAGIEQVTGRTYARAVRLATGPGILRIDFPAPGTPPTIRVHARLAAGGDADQAATLVRHLLDAQADPVAIDRSLRRDTVLAPVVDSMPGIRLPGALDGPEILFRALFGQQVSVAAARTTLARLATRTGRPLAEPDGELVRLFPTPAAIAALGADGIPGPRRRAETITAAAADLADGSLRLDPSRSTAELTADLVARPGIGPWTAGYVAMRVAKDPDVLLTGDLVLRQGAARLGLPDRDKALSERGLAWSPYRSYAGLHLWRTASS